MEDIKDEMIMPQTEELMAKFACNCATCGKSCASRRDNGGCDSQEDSLAANEVVNENLAADSEAVENDDNSEDSEAIEGGAPKKRSLKEWWSTHKPTTRRLIQVYAALLYNANINGFITGKIFTGASKVLCVPGLNCYSCPGAIGACPLGSLQNALAGTNKRAPYYMLGIILLYGLIFGRMICGYLCPVGLAQDLLYKIKTPKVQKSRVTRVLSYLKYVILVALVVGIPLAFAANDIVVPGFCKYICPAGTFGGAMLLLVHPDNANMFSMLASLFTWKTAVLVIIIAASIFIYRFFCRFLCPLGAIYGLFNKFALLGITVDDNKCTNCGKCLSVCKVDIKKVGDHECVNCGDCLNVCPTNAIVLRGSRVFLNNVDTNIVKPVAAAAIGENIVSDIVCNDAAAFGGTAAAQIEETEKNVNYVDVGGVSEKPNVKPSGKKKVNRPLIIKIVCVVLAVALLVGLLTYAGIESTKEPSGTYTFVVSSTNSRSQFEWFGFQKGDSVSTYPLEPASGSGTKDDPYILSELEGRCSVTFENGAEVYYQITLSKKAEYTLIGSKDLKMNIFFVLAGAEYGMHEFESGKQNLVSFTNAVPDGFGSGIGFKCYDFTLKKSLDSSASVSLSDYSGKIVVVNFWYTTCGPCVEELPPMQAVCDSYDNVEILAIHRVDGADVAAYLAKHGWDKWGSIEFVQDTGTSALSDTYALLGGNNGAYPRTVVVDAKGIVRAVFEGKIKSDKDLTDVLDLLVAEME